MKASVSNPAGGEGHGPQPGVGVDIHIGMRLRLRRVQLAIERDTLAQLLEVDAGEIAAFEAGERRLPPYLMARAAAGLDVPVSWFFDGLEHNTLATTDPAELSPQARRAVSQGLREQERTALALTYFRSLPEPMQVKALAILKTLAGPDETGG